MYKLFKVTLLGTVITGWVFILYKVIQFLIGDSVTSFVAFVGLLVMILISFVVVGFVTLFAIRQIYDHVEIG